MNEEVGQDGDEQRSEFGQGERAVSGHIKRVGETAKRQKRPLLVSERFRFLLVVFNKVLSQYKCYFFIVC